MKIGTVETLQSPYAVLFWTHLKLNFDAHSERLLHAVVIYCETGFFRSIKNASQLSRNINFAWKAVWMWEPFLWHPTPPIVYREDDMRVESGRIKGFLLTSLHHLKMTPPALTSHLTSPQPTPTHPNPPQPTRLPAATSLFSISTPGRFWRDCAKQSYLTVNNTFCHIIATSLWRPSSNMSHYWPELSQHWWGFSLSRGLVGHVYKTCTAVKILNSAFHLPCLCFLFIDLYIFCFLLFSFCFYLLFLFFSYLFVPTFFLFYYFLLFLFNFLICLVFVCLIMSLSFFVYSLLHWYSSTWCRTVNTSNQLLR